jgi:hypothetical protein
MRSLKYDQTASTSEKPNHMTKSDCKNMTKGDYSISKPVKTQEWSSWVTPMDNSTGVTLSFSILTEDRLLAKGCLTYKKV